MKKGVKMMNFSFKTKQDVIEIVEHLGFLPFFKNNIKGFSIEEMCPKELWFSNEIDGPWEWKGPLINEGGFLYGKLFSGKAGFVAKRFVPDLVNYRRDGYDFDSRFDDELTSYKDKNIFDTIDENKILLSKELKRICNYSKNGNKGFETVITRLQMQTYVCVNDFVYMTDKTGKPYGWGVAEYTTPEHLFGYDLTRSAYKRKPRESKEILVSHLRTVLPEVDEKEIVRIIG